MSPTPSENTRAATFPEKNSGGGDVWFCVPVYNNAATVARVTADCRKHLDHVLVVDDGSTDADLRHLLADQDVTVIRHEVNRGKGAAMLTGFEYIQSQGGRYAITLDGDGQHDPRDVTAFLPRLAPDTLVLGRRETVKGYMPDSSLLGREISDSCIEIESGGQVRDSQSGFRAYPVQAINQLPLASRQYNFEVEVVVRSIWAGLKVVDVPVSVWYPPAEERVSSFNKWHDNIRFIRLHFRLAFRQLLPIPHHRLTRGSPSEASAETLQEISPAVPKISWLRRNSSPTGLALACALALLLSLSHGLVGVFIIAYFLWRWHWNLLVTLAGLLVGYGLYEQQTWWMGLAGQVMDVQEHPDLGWFVGTHLAAVPLASAVAMLVYKAARQQQPLAATVRSGS